MGENSRSGEKVSGVLFCSLVWLVDAGAEDAEVTPGTARPCPWDTGQQRQRWYVGHRDVLTEFHGLWHLDGQVRELSCFRD